MEEPYDFGYGLRKEFWHKKIATKAGKFVVQQAKKDGLPYITATHDRNNPRSGSVMQKAGMKYCYSYEEQWKPKNFHVIFRINRNDDFICRKYWNMYSNHFVEEV